MPISFWPKEKNITCGMKILDQNKQHIYFDRFHSGALNSILLTFHNVMKCVTSLQGKTGSKLFHFVVLIVIFHFDIFISVKL